MKNKSTARFAQRLGFIVVMTVIGFSFAACGDDGGTGGGGTDGDVTAPKITTTSLPGGTVGTAYSRTLEATGDTPVTWSLAGGALPAGLSLAADGAITGTPTAAGTSTFTLKATNAAGNDTKEFSITIAAVAITTTSLPNGVVGTEYSQTLTATGTAPITWNIESGTLPADLSLAATGAITGTPTTAGTSTFTVKATNAAGSDTKQLSITIATAVAPTITTATLPDGTVGTAYRQTLTATGTAPITWSVESDALPTGLSLAESGVISGTPTTVGTSSFTVKAVNSAGNGTKQLSITITGVAPPAFIEMVQIQSGTFMMGSPANEPDRESDETQRSVTLTKGFYMGKYPVTQAQYEEVMGTNPSNFTTPVSPETSTENRPVDRVSWYDAIVFCNKLSVAESLSPAYEMQTAANTSVWSTDTATWGTVPTSSNARWDAVRTVTGSTGYRLPTEAQWEYACRAGTTTPFNTGDNITTDEANYNGNYPYNNNPPGIYRERTTEVGSFAANTWGLYDMHGNVREWCWDWYGNYASGPQTDPTGAVSALGRVHRGGSWYFDGQYQRSAYRDIYAPSTRGYLNGFRLVRPAE